MTRQYSYCCFLLGIPTALLLGCDADDKQKNGDDPSAAVGPSEPLVMVELAGGTFEMGSDHPSSLHYEQPIHEVTVPTFALMRTEVTAAQYRECIDAGACSEGNWREPVENDWCNIHPSDRASLPMNCVNWFGAREYCEWAGARLPTEAEWEFAARSGGQAREYPWGDELPTCEYAIVWDETLGRGCGEDRHWPPCSKTGGNSEQGICDLAGNISEWVQDRRHDTYEGAPTDGSAWEEGGEALRVTRGGSWATTTDTGLTTWRRGAFDPANDDISLGFRCAR